MFSKFSYRFVFWLVLLAGLHSTLLAAQADDWHFPGVSKIVAVGDVHGAYGALLETLQAAGILDEQLSWAGGDTHLVFTGDLLDRGPDSRLVMDLVMRLEQESVLAGGQVHQLLGNHEVMNLIGDVRYVSDPEYAAFAEEESAKEREHWYKRYRRSKPISAHEHEVRAEFDQKAPPGFFAYRRAFRNDGIYGKWLLEKPLMVVVSDTAFVHGGVPPYVEEHGLAGVNGQLKKDLVDYVSVQAKLVDAGIISPMDLFREIPPVLQKILESDQLHGAKKKWAQSAIELTDSPLHGPDGPTWYRGTAVCNPLMEADELNRALDRIGAKRVAFGHTTTVTRRVQQRMDGKILEIDTGMLKSSYRGSGNALIIEGDSLQVVNQDGTKELTPVGHPAAVGGRVSEFGDGLLNDILANGSIIDSDVEGIPWNLVQVTKGERTIFAQFRPSPGEEGFAPELAAYRLDRMLGLFMVPVTVSREYKGQQGTLQFLPAETISEQERVANKEGSRMYCSPAKQRGVMYVFDTLINNPSRTPLTMLYSPDAWSLMLVDHEQSFGTENSLPGHLENVDLTVGDQWRAALQEIDDEKLSRELGDVMDKNRLEALAKRRDALINLSIR